MKNKIAISQSNYIPWLGFFELASQCDTFVFLESVQYTKNDWRNRNKIRLSGKSHWLTIPVQTSNSLKLAINEVNIADHRWMEKHLTSIKHAYNRANEKRNLDVILSTIFTPELQRITKLSEINIFILQKFFMLLEINPKLLIYGDKDHFSKQERVLHICQENKATDYLTSSKGKSYLDEDVFLNSLINIELISYQNSIEFIRESGIAEYENYSIIDTIARFGLDEVKGFLRHGR